MVEPSSDSPPFGCRECGTFTDMAPADGRCDACGSGTVIELGGDPTADKAQSLMAWARRDATRVVQSRGTIVGALAGMGLATLAAVIVDGLGFAVILLVIYGAVLGAGVGDLAALAIHRRLWPDCQLQPVVDPQKRRWRRIGVTIWVALGATAGILVAALGGPPGLYRALRRLAGVALALFAG